MSRKALALASLCTIVCGFSFSAQADDLTNSKLLTYPVDAQANYISVTASAAATIAALNLPAHAKCLAEWVERNRASDFQPVRDAMRKYPKDHPTGITLAVLQKECGPFKYVK